MTVKVEISVIVAPSNEAPESSISLPNFRSHPCIVATMPRGHNMFIQVKRLFRIRVLSRFRVFKS